MPHVEVVHWNPRRVSRDRVTLAGLARVNNFGDLIGPLVVRGMLKREFDKRPRAVRNRRLLAVGSILRLAKDDDVVWGVGANGKTLEKGLPATRLDVRAVRGPRTRLYLQNLGIDAPEVYGDPALLLGVISERQRLRGNEPSRSLSIIPNLNDLSHYSSHDPRVINPTTPLRKCLALIAASDFVVGSSLHAIVVAEALGVPARLIRSGAESDFKYLDYFEGTGRSDVVIAGSVDDALRLGGAAPPEWDPAPLLSAFPRDLWHPEVAT